MIIYRCPHCKRRIWFLSEEVRRLVTCPLCHKNFSVSKTATKRVTEGVSFDEILAKMPLSDVGSREKELVLAEEDLILLGEALLNQILSLERWKGLYPDELREISNQLKRLIEILEEHDQDSDLLRLKFDLLNIFIRNFYH